MFDLTGRTALVTGGSRGLGRAISLALAGQGADIAINYRGNADAATAVAEQVRALGRRAVLVQGDTSGGREACEAIVKAALEELGKIDILVNNAGITRDSVFKRMTEQDWMAVINTNLNSVFNVTRQVIDGMSERNWGRIINISSVNAIKGQFGQTNYSAAKAGMAGFSKALAQEVVRKGVTVNTVSPGYVETDMVMAIRKEIRDQIVAQIPMGRLAKPEEIAAVVAFLASEEAGYITGANISVNGGMHMM
jgi:acetoacetyl-CoA reductase